MLIPNVGDLAKADYIEDGEYFYGTITKVDLENDLCYAELEGAPDFCGDVPTRFDGEVWIFDGF